MFEAELVEAPEGDRATVELELEVAVTGVYLHYT